MMKAHKHSLLHSAKRPVVWAMIASSGCVIEGIDAAEHEVTHQPSSTAGEEWSTGSISTGGDADSSSEGGGSFAASTTMAGTDTTDAAGSTGPVGPVCGDGVVEGEETCDDANADPDDGCKECARDSIVFISSEVYRGYELGGLDGADQRCRVLAAKAGLLRPETFRAWLSTPSMPAADRLTHSRGRYTLVNGLVIAMDWASLTSGNLMNTIMADEYSQVQDTKAWTGTLADGQPALGSEFCGDWDTGPWPVTYGGAGRSLSADSGWSFFANGGCPSLYRLYCFEN